MRTHLATVDRVLRAHALLDERMTGLGLHRRATQSRHDIDGIPGQTRIVNDALPGMLEQKRFGQETNDVIALDELTGLVEQEAAVEIPVPGHPQVGTMGGDRVTGGGTIFLEQRIGHAMRKIAIGIVVDLDELEGQMGFERVDHLAGPAIAGIDHDTQRRQRRPIDITEQVLYITPA